jgi:hypothetical protein
MEKIVLASQLRGSGLVEIIAAPSELGHEWKGKKMEVPSASRKSYLISK